ncbi:MAG: hypothetical protein A2Y25_09400 [Candidatus Melainabacteria bacterium GWF2_37_15]|nr:MAG: hypothetical protein A2Y25_09400 [Candidatus Melainabacteria bacterium GWF2_37_15]
MRKSILIIFCFFIIPLPAFSKSQQDGASCSINIKTLLDSNKSVIEDDFNAELSENIYYKGNLLFPQGSILKGNISKIEKQNILRTNACIHVIVNEIQTPDSQIISFKDDPLKLKFMDPRSKTLARKTFERAPSVIAQGVVAISLGAASNLGGGVIYAIGVGTSAGAGLISGFISPDAGLSRSRGALVRAFENTSPGTVYVITRKRYNVYYKPDSSTSLKLDGAQISRIQDSLVKPE